MKTLIAPKHPAYPFVKGNVYYFSRAITKDLKNYYSRPHLSAQTLSEFGGVIKVISSASDNVALRFSAFLLYISNHHNDILQVNYDHQKTTLCNALLEKAKVPLVAIE